MKLSTKTFTRIEATEVRIQGEGAYDDVLGKYKRKSMEPKGSMLCNVVDHGEGVISTEYDRVEARNMHPADLAQFFAAVAEHIGDRTFKAD